MMLVFISLFLFSGGALIFWGAVGMRSDTTVKLRLPVEPHAAKKRYYLASIFPFSQKILEKLRWDEAIKNRLEAAHVRISAAEFFNIKLLIVAAMVVVVIFALGKTDPLWIAGAFFAGFLLPDLWLNRKIAKRKYAIARTLPETVDLLGLCVEAGLDFSTSLKWVIEKVPKNPMIEEFVFLAEEIKWGKPRVQALKDMSKRLSIPEVSSFVQTLVQAERMGTPVAEAFAILSEDTRMQRFHRGERYAMQAPIKILIPLIFFILPVIAIIVGGPIFLQFTKGNMMSL
jgi:tight adherence protein C